MTTPTPCTCRILIDGRGIVTEHDTVTAGASIVYCAEHAAGPEAVELLRDLMEALRYHSGPSDDETVGDRERWDLPDDFDSYHDARALLRTLAPGGVEVAR